MVKKFEKYNRPGYVVRYTANGAQWVRLPKAPKQSTLAKLISKLAR